MPLPAATRRFLSGLAADNSKAWFEANRDLYEAGYRDAGAALVQALGPRLRTLSPDVQFAPKIGGSQMRVNRDTRFSRDKRPYKDHLDLWFWHGEAKGWEAPGFFLRVTAGAIWIGAGQHHLPKERLDRFRDAVVDPVAGRELEAVVAAAEAAGLHVGEADRKRVPKGYDPDHPRARFLLFGSLHAMAQLPGEAAEAPDFEDRAMEAFAAAWPAAKWLLDWT